MKKFLLLILAIFTLQTTLLAKRDKPSQIEPAAIFYIDLDPKFCFLSCLNSFAKDELYLSFLSKFGASKVDDPKLNNLYFALISGVDLDKEIVPQNAQTSHNKIAVIIPQDTIKSYANLVSNAIISYISARKLDLNVKFFLTKNESFANLANAVSQISNENFNQIIAPLTINGVNVLNQMSLNKIFFIPTINKKSVDNPSQNMIFGGIDYEAQIRKLHSMSNSKIASIYENDNVTRGLNNFVLNFAPDAYSRLLDKNDFKNLTNIIRGNHRLSNASVFLNTSLIKMASISSELRGNNIRPYALLTTQINYHPKIFEQIQPLDRKILNIANSIFYSDDRIASANNLLGVNLDYNWIGYSTNIGVDYLYSNFINKDASRLFKEEIIDNQINYNIDILRASGYKFQKVN